MPSTQKRSPAADLCSLTLAEAARRLVSRELSPVELTTAHLERIATLDGRLNAFLTVTVDDALRAARRAEDAIGRGEYRGALHGIPLAIKDLYDTRGVRTTAGSKFFASRVPDANAAVIDRLEAAGAVSLGKANMHEWALGVTNDNPHYGACRNPWSLDRITGGSSGGSAAALAAGLCLVSLGSDTGGSIRIPAALCGVVGLKPTFGRVSVRGVVPLSWNLDHPGPMARRVYDAAILFDAIAGYDDGDPFAVAVPNDDYLTHLEAGVTGWRVGLAGSRTLAGADADVVAAVQAAAALFETLGATVEEVELPELPDAARANSVMTTADAAAFHQERLTRAPRDFGADVLARLQRGVACTSSEYANARRTQTVLRRTFESWFTGYGGRFDIILAPTTPCAAPLRAGLDPVETARLLTRFTAPFNLTGLPALSIPCGFAAGPLPIGLQIVGPPWSEARVLRAGYAYEQATSWHDRWPEINE
jgi:aspartyl-tRNA(Asn)/glutamyl-tRNA(Gln) amidotransferase subunit A